MAAQLVNGKWQIEPLQDQQYKVDARRRYDYVSLMPKLALLCLSADCLYLSYRILLVRRASQMDMTVYIVLLIEIAFAATSGLLHLQSLSAWGKAKYQLPLRLQGVELPTVDVFLPCCGEDLNVIMTTVRAACSLDYPSEQYRVIVLDDGRSQQVHDSVNNLVREKKCKNLHYASRHVKIQSHSKAGNLNFGLEYVTTLESGPAEYIAVLDIDMIPLPYWLRAMLPYIVQDEKVALANPAQRFYNIPDKDPFVQNLDIVFDGMETIKDCVSASWCTGTGFVVRREAMAQIQWFPTANHNDDIMTSVYLTAAGWKIVYVPETVQWGLVPDTVRKHVRQHTRWTAAFIYSISALWNERTRGHATLQQRMGATMPAVVIVCTNAVIALSAVAIPWIMLSGSPTVVALSLEELRRLLLLESLSFIAAFAAGLARSRAADGNGEIFLDWEQVGLAPFQIITILKTTLSEVFGSTAQSFVPDVALKPPQLPFRSRSVLPCFDVDLLSHTFILSLQLVAGYIGWHALSAGSGTGLLHEVLSKGGYPAVFLLWVKYVLQTAPRIPLFLNGQTVCSSPASLLTPDVKSGELYPSDRAKDAGRTRPAQTYATLAVLYHSVVLIAAWL